MISVKVGRRQQPATNDVRDQSETGNPGHGYIRSDERELTESIGSNSVRKSLPTLQ